MRGDEWWEVRPYEILCGDCLERMDELADGSVDLFMTSPPYARQREDAYGGISPGDYPRWMGEVVGKAMRKLSPTGSFVLNIKEHVSGGVRDTYVLDTLRMLAESFRWVDTYIWVKKNPFPTGSRRRLKDAFEYCYHFAKTKEFKFFPEQAMVPADTRFAESEARRANKGAHNVSNGSGLNMSRRVEPKEMVRPSNVIMCPVDSTNHDHPATFPEALPERFIRLMTEEGDLVCDPFMGSGTTGAVAVRLGREFVGIERDSRYCDMSERRIAKEMGRGDAS